MLLPQHLSLLCANPSHAKDMTLQSSQHMRCGQKKMGRVDVVECGDSIAEKFLRSGEMAQWWSALAALAEDRVQLPAPTRGSS